MSGRGLKKGKGAGFQAFVSFCRSSVSARVSYGIALLLLWPIKGGPIRRRGRHAASATTTEPSPNRSSPLKPSSASTYPPPLPLPTPLTGNVIAGGSFARPSEVLRLVSYLEGNIVRGLPGPVNRLLTLWDVDREEMTGYRDTFPHVVQIYTERFLGRPWFRGDKGYVLWLRFCLIVRWMGWVVEICESMCSSKVSCIVRVFVVFLASLRILLITIWSIGRWDD